MVKKFIQANRTKQESLELLHIKNDGGMSSLKTLISGGRMYFITLAFDIIKEIEDNTIKNKHFNSKEWCLEDAEILIKAGKMIKREIKKHDTEMEQGKTD